MTSVGASRLLLTKKQVKSIMAGKLVKARRNGETIAIGLKGLKTDPITRIDIQIERLKSKKLSLIRNKQAKLKTKTREADIGA